MENVKKKKRVLVAMSGGVDSSAAAAILVDQGYEVIGMTMQVWDYTKNTCDLEEGKGTCCSSTDVDDARTVADMLGIPFYVANCEDKFQSYVIDDFVESYLDGKTPIPCVHCNTHLKFDHLITKMKQLNCDYLATGHYAQIVDNSKGESTIVSSCDDWKDQTYFLFTLQPELLGKILFPVGNMKKSEVREYCVRRGLDVAKKKDSTGICFIGKGGYTEFIKDKIPTDLKHDGDIKLHPSGEVIGQHEGIFNFTIGQRRGLGVSSNDPLFVREIDAKTKTLWLSTDEHLYKKQMQIKNINWLDTYSEDEKVRIKIRFAHHGSLASLKKVDDNLFDVEFDEPQRAITPGQAAVFYRENQLLGGGWIV